MGGSSSEELKKYIPLFPAVLRFGTGHELFVFYVVVKAAFTTILATKTLLQNIFSSFRQKPAPDLVKGFPDVRINRKQKEKRENNNNF